MATYLDQGPRPGALGSSDATPDTDPNPRLEAYLDAVRRGAKVRILLDSFFDRGDNAATVAYLRTVAGGGRTSIRDSEITCLEDMAKDAK